MLEEAGAFRRARLPDRPWSIRPSLFRQFPPKRLPRSRLRQGRSPHRPPSRLPKRPLRGRSRPSIRRRMRHRRPTSTQSAPTNVNISVRIDSPGDNGSVEQVNAAVTETDAHVSAGHAAVSAPDTGLAAPTADPAPRRPQQSRHRLRGLELELELELWRCRPGDAGSRQEVGTQNWTWNWDWNCGAPDHYLGIPLDKTRRSINLVLRSIGRSISTSRFASTARGTTAPSARRTWRLVTAPSCCRRSESRCRPRPSEGHRAGQPDRPS